MDSGRRRLTKSVALVLVPGALVHVATGAEITYRRITVANLAGSSNQGEVSVAPGKLIRVFGQPTDEPWDSESLGAFYFNGPNDETFSVYHRAYDVLRTNELKRLFWSRETASEFSVGARTEAGVEVFKNWLVGELSR